MSQTAAFGRGSHKSAQLARRGQAAQQTCQKKTLISARLWACRNHKASDVINRKVCCDCDAAHIARCLRVTSSASHYCKRQSWWIHGQRNSDRQAEHQKKGSVQDGWSWQNCSSTSFFVIKMAPQAAAPIQRLTQHHFPGLDSAGTVR